MGDAFAQNDHEKMAYLSDNPPDRNTPHMRPAM